MSSNDHFKRQSDHQRKSNRERIDGFIGFEDVGDIGNEYIFKQPEGDRAIYSTDFPHQIEVIANSALYGVVKVTQMMQIPVSADEQLLEEQKQSSISVSVKHKGRNKQCHLPWKQKFAWTATVNESVLKRQ